MAADQRRAIVDQGMKDLEKALELNPDYSDAMFYVNHLYREPAKMETNAAQRAQWSARADEWQKKGLEVRKKVQEKQRLEQAKQNPLEGI